MGNGSQGTADRRVAQGWILQAIQQGESFVYALQTREGAIKIGVTKNLAQRKNGMKFGGVDHILAFRPGDYDDEQAIHRSLAEHRIPGTREYYYPVRPIRDFINEIREAMGVRPLRHKDLPRLAACKFHRRVTDAQVHGTSVFARD